MDNTRFEQIQSEFFTQAILGFSREKLEKLLVELCAEGKFVEMQTDTVRGWIPSVKHLLDMAWKKEQAEKRSQSDRTHKWVTYTLSIIAIIISALVAIFK